ncbi:MAG: histidinol dehydrogenase [Spirochaetales bacterium]|nr:histidinol dehydrogenase [Spirochaetales bacterium]
MTILHYPGEKSFIKDKLKKRKELYDPSLVDSIRDIFHSVRKDGDDCIYTLTKKYDHTDLSSIRLTDDYIMKCVKDASPELVNAIKQALKHIEQVNSYLLQNPITTAEIRNGTIIGEKITPLHSVGLYVPARKGPLISTALMLIGAAKTAKVNRIIVGMAPDQEGRADPATVAAAHIAGAHQIFTGNGVGLIAGFTSGTESIPEVDGIFGPGPGGIAVAMSIAFSYGKKTVLGIGPTDSIIVTDETGNPGILVYDLISEAEHGPDSSSVLVTTSEEIARKTSDLLDSAISQIPDTRRKILNHVFSKDGYGAIILCNSMDDAIKFIDDFAPEHMNVTCNKKNEEYIVNNVRNAGEILIGENTPFTAANYAIGITAVLPTNGYARTISGITSKDMIKISTIGKLNKSALHELLPVIREIGKHEGLPSHILAVEKRFS